MGIYGTAAHADSSLCTSSEKIIFTCGTKNNKVISLCASKNLTAAAGYMQYRFGVPGKTPEMTFPAVVAHPGNYFFSGSQMYSGGGAAYLKFRNGRYIYTVFTGSGKGWEKEGVVVNGSGSKSVFIPCKSSSTSEIGPVLFEQIKIPRDPDENDFEVP